MKKPQSDVTAGRLNGQALQKGGTGFTRCFEMNDPFGFHARPAALFIKTAQQFTADVTVSNARGMSVNGKSIMGLLILAIQYGERFQIAIQGADAREALEAIERLIASVFGPRQPDTESIPAAGLAVLSDMALRRDAGVYAQAER